MRKISSPSRVEALPFRPAIKKFLTLLALLALTVHSFAAGRRIELLFLGDQGHHKPADRFFQLCAALGTHGIDLTYTENLADLNAVTLAKYDGLILYANHEKIAPEQEKALIEYVESGHGFVPLHCASACFGNSPRFLALVGGRFKSHATGEFETKITARFYRFKPDGSKLEYLGQSSNNTWGFALSENGDVFGSTANNQPSIYLPIAKRYYDMVDSLEAPTIPGIDTNRKVPLLMERIRQVDVMGGFTAEAGHNLYTARSFPQDFWNRAALLCEPTCHVLYKGLVDPAGTSFTTANGWNLAASDDEWLAPVQAKTGPDGAIWISDFYSFIIQHNPTPNPERGGFNLVIVKPASIEKCCTAADAQAAQPNAIAKNYIPALADILQATKLLNPGETEVLKFDLKTPGDYPYFCTFPGHCHVMRGVLKVQP